MFDSGDEVTVEAGEQGVRFLLVSGRPIREPIAFHCFKVAHSPDSYPRSSADTHSERILIRNCPGSRTCTKLDL